MPGTFDTKLLANGQLGNSEADVYLVPGATTAIVVNVILVNTDSVARTIELYVKKASGTSRRIVPKTMSLDAGYSLETDEELTLGAGDAIRGSCSTASVVDFTVYGIEET